MRRSSRIPAAALLWSLIASVALTPSIAKEGARQALELLAPSLIERPDQLESLDEPTVTRALATIEELLQSSPDVELRAELLYRRAMLRLEPLTTYNPEGAKQDLAALLEIPSAWAARARYAQAWLEEVGGRVVIALDGYRRIEIDHPASEAAAWADVGRARLQLRGASYGRAAARLQNAIDAGLDDPSIRTLRELAVGGLMRDVGAGDPSSARPFDSGVRTPMAMLAAPGGGLVLATRRPAAVVRFAEDGARTDEWIVDGLQAVTISPAGRVLAAGKETIFRLERGGRSVPIADLGEFKALDSIAAAADGSLWLLERRGRIIGRLPPGAASPEVTLEDETLRLNSLLASGRRLLALDSRSRSLLAIEADGSRRVIFDGKGRRLESPAVDRSGRIAMLDRRSLQVVFVEGSGRLERVVDARQYLEQIGGLALGPQGELMLHDGKSRWVAIR